jgi:hypothetical protein
MNWKQKTQMKTTKQDSKRESNSTIELAFMRLLLAVLKTALLIAATVCTAQAEPRQHKSQPQLHPAPARDRAGVRRPNNAPDHRQARDRHLQKRFDVRGRSRCRRERHSMNEKFIHRLLAG